MRPIGNLKQKIKRLTSGLAATFLISSSVLSGLAPLSSTTVEAKDASHQGMTYLEVKVDTGTNQLQGVVNTEGQFNSWGGSDVPESSEYKKEQITWGHRNWTFVESLLNNKQIAIPELSPDGATFDAKGKSTDFKDSIEGLKNDGKGWGGGAVALVMSFPGWGAGDKVPDVSSGDTAVSALIPDGDRNSEEAETFANIDGTAAANAASAVNNKLVGGLNSAIADFVEQMRDSKGNKVQLSREGMANLVWLLANGKFPKPGSNVTYDPATAKITGDFVDMKMSVVKNPWSRSRAGETLVTMRSPGKDGDKTETDADYVFAVVKGYHGGVGEKDSDTYASDAYALTWYDIAMSLSAQMVAGTVEDESEASTTVVGDQVNSFMYTAISGILGVFNVKKTDDVVFGDAGNLLRSNVFNILTIVQSPFLAAAFLILGLVILDAYRKVNMAYLSTGEQRSIMSSVGRVANAILAMAFTALISLLVIYLDQLIVDFAIGLNALFNGFNYGASWTEQMDKMFGGGLGILGGVLGFVNPANLILAIVMAGIDIKFTWRYIARAISFGLYYCIAPVLFALDALKGNGRLFEFGPMAGQVWKNISGTILMRGMDALGIVFSLALSKILFGTGMLIKIMSLLSAEAISNTLLGLFGVQDSSIKGISQTGQMVFNKAKGAVMAAGGAAATAVAGKAYAAYKSGKNFDDKQILQGMGLDGSPTSGKKKAAGLSEEVKMRKPGEKVNPRFVAQNKNAEEVKDKSTIEQVATSTTPTAGGVSDGQLNVESTPTQESVGTVVALSAPVEEVHDNGLQSTTTDSAELVAGGAQNSGQPVSETFSNGETASTGNSSTLKEKAQTGWGKVKSVGKTIAGTSVGTSFAQGFTNKGVHGDPNTVAGGGIQIANKAERDVNNYKLGSRGQVKNKGLWDGIREGNGFTEKAGLAAKYKGQALRDAGRGFGRALGGAASVVKPRDFGRIAATSAFAASSTLTKTNLDNMAATAIAAHQFQDSFTGQTQSNVGNAVARSFFGRSIGLNPGAMTFDEVTASGMDNHTSALGKGGEVSEASREASKYHYERGLSSDGNSMTEQVSYGADVKNKADKAAFAGASALHQKMGGSLDNGGLTQMSLDQVINSIDDNAYQQVNPEIANLAQYMTENGYNNVKFDGDNVAFESQLQNQGEVELVNAEQGSFERFVAASAKANQYGEHVDNNGTVYKINESGNAQMYADTNAENRAIMSAQYGEATKQAIKEGNGQELKSLLREQRDMGRSPEKFVEKYPNGVQAARQAEKENRESILKDIEKKAADAAPKGSKKVEGRTFKKDVTNSINN